jgi:ethanolamine utilization protein EutA (predicted chaperonin)
VLGQALKAALPKRPLLVIDQVQLAEGAVLRRRPAFVGTGEAVPLSVKTLVFSR